MPWLVRDGKVLATLEVAASLRDRTRGLLGRDSIDGALLLRPAKSVHTVRMRFPIDVAFCDGDLRVLRVATLAPNRVSRPVLKAHCVIESEAGTMDRWGVRVGDKLEIRGLDPDGVIDVRDSATATDPRPPRSVPRPDAPNAHRAEGVDGPVIPDADPERRPPVDLVGDGDPGHP